MYKAELKREINAAFSEMNELTKKNGDWISIFGKTTNDEEILKIVLSLQKQWLKAANKYKKASWEFYIMYSVPMLRHYRRFNIPDFNKRSGG